MSDTVERMRRLLVEEVREKIGPACAVYLPGPDEEPEFLRETAERVLRQARPKFTTFEV